MRAVSTLWCCPAQRVGQRGGRPAGRLTCVPGKKASASRQAAWPSRKTCRSGQRRRVSTSSMSTRAVGSPGGHGWLRDARNARHPSQRLSSTDRRDSAAEHSCLVAPSLLTTVASVNGLSLHCTREGMQNPSSARGSGNARVSCVKQRTGVLPLHISVLPAGATPQPWLPAHPGGRSPTQRPSRACTSGAAVYCGAISAARCSSSSSTRPRCGISPVTGSSRNITMLAGCWEEGGSGAVMPCSSGGSGGGGLKVSRREGCAALRRSRATWGYCRIACRARTSPEVALGFLIHASATSPALAAIVSCAPGVITCDTI